MATFKVGDIVLSLTKRKGIPIGTKLRVCVLYETDLWVDRWHRYEIFYFKREVKNITGKLSRALYGK